jgi:hypothetical protein
MMCGGECAGADSSGDRRNIRIDPRSGIETGRVVGVAGAAEMRVRLADKPRVGGQAFGTSGDFSVNTNCDNFYYSCVSATITVASTNGFSRHADHDLPPS